MDEETEKIAKPWGEGKAAKRQYTDKSKPEGEEVQTQILQPPRTVFATVATDNRNFNMDDWPEFQKRALQKGVDGSKSQTEAILYRKALEHADRIDRSIDPVKAAEIREYMGAIPVNQFHDHPNNKIVNPATVEIIEQRPLPTEFAEARFDGEKLLGFIETVTLINHTKRFTIDTGRGYKMLTTPVDVWYTMKIIGESMIMSALNLTDESQAILRFLRESKSSPSKRDIQQGLQQAGYNITKKDIAKALESMIDRMYVREQQGTPNTYVLSEFASITKHEVGIDYQVVVDACKEHIYDTPGVPEAVAEDYVERFCEGEGLFAIHPFTGEEVDITEDTELQEVIDGATESAEETFDEPMFGSETSTNDDTADAQAEAKTQGTLAD